MHNAQCTIHNAQYTMHNAQCTVHITQNTVETVATSPVEHLLRPPDSWVPAGEPPGPRKYPPGPRLTATLHCTRLDTYTLHQIGYLYTAPIYSSNSFRKFNKPLTVIGHLKKATLKAIRKKICFC